jgi:type II secretory pathway predicted ATPase ExeA/septal ring-binding cell division protein DamX
MSEQPANTRYRHDTRAAGSRGPDPFESSWRQEYWYNEPVREKRLYLLLHLAPYSAVLMVTGDEGSGKTTLLHQFLARANDTWRICSIQGAADIDHLEILDTLEQELSLRAESYADEDERILYLRESLHALRRGSLVPIVVVDDAHLLPQAALTMITRLTEPREDGEILLGALMFGEESLLERFTLPGPGNLREHVNHTFELTPFGEEGTAGYIRHRMQVAGRDPDSLFTPAVLKFIHVASRGQPGRINELARGVLRNEGQMDYPMTAAPGLVGRVLLRYGLAAFAISLVVVALFYQDTLKEFATTGPAPVVVDSGAPPALPGPASVEPVEGEQGPDAPVTGDIPPPPSDEVATALAADPVPAPADPPSSAGADTRAEGERQTPVIEAMPPEDPSPAPVQAAVEPTPSSRTPMDTPAAESPWPRGADWLLAQAPGHFTLQLFASTEDRARAFVERHGLGEGIAIFRAKGGDAPLYAVTHGIYPTRQDAATAAGLPGIAGLEGVKPWVRSLRDVQGVIGATEP